MDAYDDIIDLPHPTSAKHPRMPMANRATQFQPFQALSGYGSAIQETARVTGERAELTEDEKLRYLLETGGEAIFTYFRPDQKKDGGAYVDAVGAVKKINLLEGQLFLENGTVIPIEDILEIGDITAQSGQY